MKQKKFGQGFFPSRNSSCCLPPASSVLYGFKNQKNNQYQTSMMAAWLVSWVWRGPRFAPKIEDIHRFQVYVYIYIYTTLFCWESNLRIFLSPPQQIPDDGTSQAAKKDDLENLTVTDGTLLKVKCWKGWSGALSWAGGFSPPVEI